MREHHHTRGDRALSANETRVLSCLRKAKEPLSAYAILDQVRPSGISHPPTVYRALKALEELGMVHRLKSLGAFVACGSAGSCEGHFAFAFCRECQKVVEITLDEKRHAELLKLAPAGIDADQVTLELAGICDECRRASAS